MKRLKGLSPPESFFLELDVDSLVAIVQRDGESYDFGRPKWHLLDTLKVPSVYRGLRLVYTYDDNFHDNIDISEELKIEYYD